VLAVRKIECRILGGTTEAAKYRTEQLQQKEECEREKRVAFGDDEPTSGQSPA